MNTDCDMNCRKCKYFSNIFGCLKEINVEECISKRKRGAALKGGASSPQRR